MALRAAMMKRTTALRVQEVAELLSVSTRQIYMMVDDNEIPSFKVGGAIRFDPLMLAAWLEKTVEAPRFESLQSVQALKELKRRYPSSVA